MKFSELAFVKSTPDGIVTSAWCVTPTGDYSLDCRTGGDYFRSLLALATANDNIMLITTVLQALVTSTTVLSGIEIGFLQAVAELAFVF